MTLSVALEQLQDNNGLLAKEWLVTNGLGGYASGTLLGAPTRRYHGMFVPDLPSPWGRTVIIPRLDEEVVVEGESLLLSGIEFEHGRLESDLTKVISAFTREWQTPVWRCAFKGRRLEKRVIMPYRHNSVYVEYRLLEGEAVHLHFPPLRDLSHAGCAAPRLQEAALSAHGDRRSL
jgi:predicted glycogen debranching enzyme